MELSQNVLKHQLRDHDLMVADLTGNTTFQLYRIVFINVVQVF